jgi:hypothetical protein
MRKLKRQLGLRISEEDYQELERVASACGLMSRNALARMALRVGLEEIERDPGKHVKAWWGAGRGDSNDDGV